MGRWLLVVLVGLVACAPAAAPHADNGAIAGAPVQSKLVEAYPTSQEPGIRARIVCAMGDATPTKWSDVVIRDGRPESCDVIARGECDGRGDIVRPCSADPLPGPLVPRGVFVLSFVRPEGGRYETFTSQGECAEALRERAPSDASAEWLDAQIAVESRDLAEAKTSLRAAERKLSNARTEQAPDIALLQLEVEKLRQKRDLTERLLAGLREQREQHGKDVSPIACGRAGGS